MRLMTVAVILSFMLGAADVAFAQAPPMGRVTPDMGATSSAQPQIPPAVQPDGASSNTSAASDAMPEHPIAPPSGFSEPDLRTPKAVGGKSTSYVIKDAPLPGDYVMGKPSAPVVMVEYASLSCPHCAYFSNAVLPAIIKKYVDTGRVRYVLRQFPLNEPALKGAMLLYCVGEQDKSKYFTFAKVLFDAQNKWAFDSNYLSGLQTIAEVGGLSKDQFQHCVNNSSLEMKVLQDKKLATDQLNVPHTPYIFINGHVYDGAHSVEAVSAFIDQQLEQVKKKIMADDLDALQRKIDEAKTHAGKGEAPDDVPAVNLGQALRFSIELLAGIAAGGALGYFIDRWLHTFPWMFILGFFAGAAAGFRNLLRQAGKDDDSMTR